MSSAIKFLITLGKTQSILAARCDRGLNGLGFNEFTLLFHLDQADENKMRRVDLAGKIGMTASGVTRLLLPMEKIGLVKSGPAQQDARVRYVVLSSAGKRKLSEALEKMEMLAEDIIPPHKTKDLNGLSDLLVEIGGRALMS